MQKKKTKLERDYQVIVLAKIRKMFPSCIILKNDSSYMQGIPDWLILNEDRWAILEFKRDSKSSYQPNQPYYITLLNNMSFCAAIYPENEEEVLRGLQQSLQPRGSTFVPGPE